LNSRNNRFLPFEELEPLFASYNFAKKPLIFSCGSGVTACIVLFAAELVLSNNKSLYDGSWSEWAASEESPIHASYE
jgi:thiosulfate/3-mercaptopyruvate sulfurtransferase